MEELNAQPQAEIAPEEAVQIITGQQTELPETFKVRFNHEDVELPYDEAVTHIQKGMNYDKKVYELNELKEEMGFIDAQAENLGLSRRDFIKLWQESLTQQEIKQLAQEKAIPEDVAKELADLRRQKEAGEKLSQEKRREGHLGELSKFLEHHPEITKAADFPQAVVDDWLSGAKLHTAYKAYQADVLAGKLKMMEQIKSIGETNEKNAMASMGPASTAGDATPFEITEENVKKMSSEERRKLMSEIMKEVMSGRLKAI